MGRWAVVLWWVLSAAAPAYAVDLQVLAAIAPVSGDTAHAGSTFTVRYTIFNTGQALSRDFHVTIRYCPSAAPTGCVDLGGTLITDDFGVDEGRVYDSPALTLPGVVQYGRRYIRVVADSTDRVSETNEANNDRYDDIDVTVRPNLLPYEPVVPATGSADAPGAVFTVRPRAWNEPSTSGFTTDFFVDYHFCPEASASGCVRMAREEEHGNFSAGTLDSMPSGDLVVPDTATNGTRWVRIVLDATNVITEGDETDNEAYLPVSVTGARPDLLVELTDAPPSLAGAGAGFTVGYRLRNVRAQEHPDDVEVSFQRCDAGSSASCEELQAQTVTGGIAGNASMDLESPSVVLPDDVRFGEHYLRVVVDEPDAVLEWDEENNDAFASFAVETRPDLVTRDVLVPLTGSTAAPGLAFTARVRIENAPGTSFHDADVVVAHAYCPTESNEGCIALDEEMVDADLAAGESWELDTLTLAMPAEAEDGTRYFRVALDPGDAAEESDESNNVSYHAIVVGTPPADAGTADAGGHPDGGPDDGGAGADGGTPTGGDGGCGCRVADGARPRGAVPWPLLALALGSAPLLLARRRLRGNSPARPAR